KQILEAAESLKRRAAKLANRIDADLAAIDGDPSPPEDALRAACHTLGGAGVAAQRNIEAAERFGAIALLLAAEADRLDAANPRGGEGLDEDRAPVLDIPASVGANVLKLARND